MRTIAFVFARGGSKGLPGKNIKPLGGLPLIAHSIRTAQAVAGIEKVYVSTDDAAIADTAVRFGARVIERPAELATDTSPEWLAWQHAVRWVGENDGPFGVFISLPATSPLRSTADVDACLAALDDETDVVITVTPAARSPYFNMVTRDPGGRSSIVLASAGFARRQDAPDVFDMTTVAYVCRPDFILGHTRLFEGRVRSVVIPRERAVDIDDQFDFTFAEVLLGAHK